MTIPFWGADAKMKSARGTHRLVPASLMLLFAACGSGNDSGQATVNRGTVSATGQIRVRLIPQASRPAPGLIPLTSSLARTAAIGPHDEFVFIGASGDRVHLSSVEALSSRQVSRDGTGPGEYKEVAQVSSCGDRGFVISDVGNNRLSYYQWDGEFAHDVGDLRYPVAVIDCDEEGQTVVAARPSKFPRFGAADADMRTSIYSWPWDRSILRTIPDVDAGEYRVLGSLYQVVALDSKIAYGTGREGLIYLSESMTGTRDSVAAGIVGRRPSDESFSSAIEKQVAGLSEESERQFWRKQFARMPHPDQLPAYFQIEGASPDLLWVVTSPPGAKEVVIDVLATSSGKVVGGVLLPSDAILVSVSEDRFVVIREDGSTGESRFEFYSWTHP